MSVDQATHDSTGKILAMFKMKIDLFSKIITMLTFTNQNGQSTMTQKKQIFSHSLSYANNPSIVNG